ncbi:MAG TPA: hypothetical protein ENK07_03860 [Bacteroidetes bacterium]|nr:hypothetical protein [Bacteroidota bacterium]
MSEIPMAYGEKTCEEVTRQGDLHRALMELNDVLLGIENQIDRMGSSCVDLGGPLTVVPDDKKSEPQIKPIPSLHTKLRETIRYAIELRERAATLASAFEERI